MNKLESPSPKDVLCHVWLKLAKWFWKKWFFKFFNVFSQFRNYLSLEKDGALEQTWNPFIQGCFVLCLVEIGPVVQEKIKMWKVNNNAKHEMTTTDNGQILIRKAHLCSPQLRWVVTLLVLSTLSKICFTVFCSQPEACIIPYFQYLFFSQPMSSDLLNWYVLLLVVFLINGRQFYEKI